MSAGFQLGVIGSLALSVASSVAIVILLLNLSSYNINKLASDGDLLHPPCGTALTFL